MASEKTKLEWALAILSAAAGALGLRTYVQKTLEMGIQKTVGPLLAPLLEDKRAELVEEIRKLTPENQKVLERRLTHPREPFTQARLVQLLAKLQKDPNTGRCETLTWLAQSTDDSFYAVMNILYHDTLLEWARKLTNGNATSENMGALKGRLNKTASDGLRVAKSIGQKIDDAAKEAAPVIDSVADWLESLADNLEAERKRVK